MRRSVGGFAGLPWSGLALLLVVTVGATIPWVDLRVEALRRDLDGILASTGWRSAEWGVLAVSLDTGDTLFARAAGTAMTPASNVKVLTTAAALHYLGPDFRYETYVLATGPVVNGRLQGDLVLYGTGDPGLSDRFYPSRTTVFEALADELTQAGIRAVDGRVVGDGTFFSGPLLAPGWSPADLNDWFAAPVGALSFAENVVTLRIEAGASRGSAPVVHTIPEDRGLPVDNLATTDRGRVYVEREHPRDPIRVVGSLPIGSEDVWRRLTIRDPTRYAAQAFRDVLEAKGVRVARRVGTVTSVRGSALTGKNDIWAPAIEGPAPRIVARHRSPPLTEYLAVVNKESHNLIAETTFKTLGRVVEGEGSFAGGARVVRRFLDEIVGVGDEPDLQVVDGSGLSTSNRISPTVFVAVLEHVANSELWTDFWGTLPEAGNRRELARMYRSPAAGNLRAKTGTIRGVSALTGLVNSANGERIAFSIISNRVPSTWGAKRVEDRIGERLARFERPFVRSPAHEASSGGPGSETSDGPGAPPSE